jgi:hypothetical protein
MTVDMTRSPDTVHAWPCPEKQGRRPGTLEKRRKLSGKPQSPALAATADSPKGADPAEAGQAVARGIVKWLVDVVDETGETVALATILTMVKKLDQN